MKIRKSELKKLISEEAANIKKQKTLAEYRGKNTDVGGQDGVNPIGQRRLAKAHVMFAVNKPVGSVGGVIDAALHNGYTEEAMNQLESHLQDVGGIFDDTSDRYPAKECYEMIMSDVGRWHTYHDSGLSKNIAWGQAETYRNGTAHGVLAMLLHLVQYGHYPDSHMGQDPDALVMALAEMGKVLR